MGKEGEAKDISSPGDKATIEDAFELLSQGKEFQKNDDNWNAAFYFVQGREILKKLAKDQPRETEEEQEIATLYEEKAADYFQQSRKCLMAGMEQDLGKQLDDAFYESQLSDQDAEHRIRTFYSLFAKKVVMEATVGEKKENVIDQQWSIEERLQELNASLPSGFKTDEERMDSINRGLNRLGLSLYSQKKPFERLMDPVPKSEEEQIDEIMAQAKDEVAFEKKFAGQSSGPNSSHNIKNDSDDDDDNDDQSDDISNSDSDLLLEDDQLAIKHIRQRVVKAQTALAELVAFLDEAKVAVKAEDEEDVNSVGDDSDQDIEKPSSKSFLSSGRKRLRGAQKNLRKAMEEWKEAQL